ncbi:hypothetical protein LRS71_11760 [Rhodococcus pyridinivorans]|uniref:hypothetical protein n=1 Tax=Rhodococcus pyridinivorans TaxID=103816 RepID=UPI001E363F31|nr:hypothetical protein [Rhodococcus pyridinivorans]MCD5420227.1 hypothetical protein [Rhodococcus pyridinivorans]
MGITDVVGKAPRNAWSLFVAEPALGLLDAVFGGVPAPIVRTAYRLTAIDARSSIRPAAPHATPRGSNWTPSSTNRVRTATRRPPRFPSNREVVTTGA